MLRVTWVSSVAMRSSNRSLMGEQTPGLQRVFVASEGGRALGSWGSRTLDPGDGWPRDRTSRYGKRKTADWCRGAVECNTSVACNCYMARLRRDPGGDRSYVRNPAAS